MIYGKTIYGNKVKIKKNTICYESEKGHKNFYYPSENKLIIKEELFKDNFIRLSIGKKRHLKVKIS